MRHRHLATRPRSHELRDRDFTLTGTGSSAGSTFLLDAEFRLGAADFLVADTLVAGLEPCRLSDPGLGVEPGGSFANDGDFAVVGPVLPRAGFLPETVSPTGTARPVPFTPAGEADVMSEAGTCSPASVSALDAGTRGRARSRRRR